MKIIETLVQLGQPPTCLFDTRGSGPRNAHRLYCPGAGVKPGDIITAINGHQVGADPVAQFDKVLSKPHAIKLGVLRNGRKIEVVVVPDPAED